MPEEMHYLPYKGMQYSGGYAGGLKLLILGLSFYGDVRSPAAPTEAVEQYIAGAKWQFFTKVQRMVTGEAPSSEADRRAFWERIAFTNLVQEPMATAGTQPTTEQWRPAWACFPEIIRATSPDLIFCFTLTGWNIQERFDTPFLNSSGRQDIRAAHRPDNYAWIYDCSPVIPGHRALAGAFKHPSRNNELSEWHAWAELLLQEAPGVLGKNSEGV